MTIDFTDQRVLVTGASSGIGASSARALAARGAVVGLAARRTERLEAVAAEIEAGGGRSEVFTVDLADLDGIESFAAEVEASLGRVDVLVNNAGAPRRRRMQALTVDELTETMAIDFESPVRLTLALLPGMLDRRHGRIVNVSSMGTRFFAIGTGAYAAAKGALQYATEALYFDLIGTGVRAQLFVPGSTATEFSIERDGNDPPFPAPPNGFMDPADVAEALLALFDSDDYEGFACDEHRDASHAKYGDVNAYLTSAHAKMSKT